MSYSLNFNEDFFLKINRKCPGNFFRFRFLFPNAPINVEQEYPYEKYIKNKNMKRDKLPE